MTVSSRGRARIGVFVPFTNSNLEPDLAMMRPDGVSVHVARIGGYDEDEIPDEDQMASLGASDMAEPLRMIQGVKPDVVMYGCTSATLAHGPAFDRELAGTIRTQSGAQTVTAAGALVHALTVLGVRRIGFASPYVASLNDRAIAFLGDEGFETVSRADVEGELSNDGQGALMPDDVFALGLRADAPEAEAMVLSCTDMRSLEVIERLEQALGKPVVTSNQAMMFQALQMLGIVDVTPGFGQLFERL
ncbi:Asp/Glu racemase [Roseovarius sp. 2305UL8-3]|uniref:maleate cis-trans isomerase family protein n=1 Tax=Roseovarius conchicola TaxID=3121636 RepID=UPI0035291544